jgi:hypothetical protein
METRPQTGTQDAAPSATLPAICPAKSLRGKALTFVDVRFCPLLSATCPEYERPFIKRTTPGQKRTSQPKKLNDFSCARARLHYSYNRRLSLNMLKSARLRRALLPEGICSNVTAIRQHESFCSLGQGDASGWDYRLLGRGRCRWREVLRGHLHQPGRPELASSKGRGEGQAQERSAGAGWRDWAGAATRDAVATADGRPPAPTQWATRTTVERREARAELRRS